VWLRFLLLSQVLWIKGVVKYHGLWQLKWIHEAFKPPNDIATCHPLNHTLPYFTANIIAIIRYQYDFLQTRALNRSQLMALNIAPPDCMCGLLQHHEENLGSLVQCSHNASTKDSPFWTYTNHCHSPCSYCCHPSQQPCPGTPQFCQHSSFCIMTSFPPSTTAAQEFPSYGSLWQE